jgi:hypothetical protein
VFTGQDVGISAVSEKISLVSFMSCDLAFFDHQNPGASSAPQIPSVLSVRNNPFRQELWRRYKAGETILGLPSNAGWLLSVSTTHRGQVTYLSGSDPDRSGSGCVTRNSTHLNYLEIFFGAEHLTRGIPATS